MEVLDETSVAIIKQNKNDGFGQILSENTLSQIKNIINLVVLFQN